MKLELRCHAVLCKTEAKAKAMAVQLHEKITFALKEFMREKTRKQNSRLTLQRTRSLPLGNSVVPKRTQMLSIGQNFKPPISKSNTAPRLGAITEDYEYEEEEEEEEEDEMMEEIEETEDESTDGDSLPSPTINALSLLGHDRTTNGLDFSMNCLTNGIIDLEIGNDINQLKLDRDVQFCISNVENDSDEESSESGFHESDSKDGSIIATDDTSLDGEDVVCEIPSAHIPDETEVTCF